MAQHIANAHGLSIKWDRMARIGSQFGWVMRELRTLLESFSLLKNPILDATQNTHRGARTHDHKVKSLALCRLS